MMKISYNAVYNISNIVGIALIGIGAGMFDIRCGLTITGVLELLLNYSSLRIARAKK